jgi:hypothetical protein
MNVITAFNLKTAMPSAIWMQKLKSSLAAFAAPDSPLVTGLLVDNWIGPEAVQPIYSVGLKSIMNPNVLASLDQPICVRFIAGGPDPTAQATGCWATPEAVGLPAKIVAAVRGFEATDVLASAGMLNQLSIVTGQPDIQFEIRVLRIPGLCLEAFWLKYMGLQAGSEDWIVPYGLVQSGTNLIKLAGGVTLNKNQAYPASEFLPIVASAAQIRLAADNNAPPNAV